MLIDNHNRTINYLRLAVTDRCNLRCNYCMPEDGIRFAQQAKLLTIEELCLVSEKLVEMGIDKIRITGGEPFVRKDLMKLFRKLSALNKLKDISVTTNATLIGNHIDELKALGIKNINVSLDAVTPETFKKITRRADFNKVQAQLYRLIEEGFNVKINFVVLNGQNTSDILPMAEWAKKMPVSVRFLEEMPFNGGSRYFQEIQWNYRRLEQHLMAAYPTLKTIPVDKTSTSILYEADGFVGNLGIIPAFSRTFCGSCNRLRISATGDIITCLYGKPVGNVRNIIRNFPHSGDFENEIRKAVRSRAVNGFEAQQKHEDIFKTSMTSIGG